MVNNYLNSHIDAIPALRTRGRLDHLDLRASPQQIFNAISYLSTHSIKTQSQTIKPSSDKEISNTAIHINRLAGTLLTLL